MNLKELASNEKPYYGSGQHYEEYDNFKDFYDEMKDFDVDLNLCYRFDIREEESERYTISLYTILQRKGRVTEHYVNVFKEEDIKLLKKYIEPSKKVCGLLLAF